MSAYYYCEAYDNFNMFYESRPEEANELLETLNLTLDDIANDTPRWADDCLIYYPTLEDYGTYEYTDGWYADLTPCRNGFNFNGAPNPCDFINFHTFGEACIDSVDPTTAVSVGEGVVTTFYGW